MAFNNSEAPVGFFGSKPDHVPSPEEKSSPFGWITYTWLQDTISKAVKGELPRGLVLDLSLYDTAYMTSSRMYSGFCRQLQRATHWDCAVNDRRFEVRRKDDAASRGVIAKIDLAANGKLLVVVAWSVEPASYERLDAKSRANGGPSVWFDGTLNGHAVSPALPSSSSASNLRDRSSRIHHGGSSNAYNNVNYNPPRMSLEEASDLRFVAFPSTALAAAFRRSKAQQRTERFWNPATYADERRARAAAAAHSTVVLDQDEDEGQEGAPRSSSVDVSTSINATAPPAASVAESSFADSSAIGYTDDHALRLSPTALSAGGKRHPLSSLASPKVPPKASLSGAAGGGDSASPANEASDMIHPDDETILIAPSAPSIAWALFEVTGWPLVWAGLPKLVYDACYLSSPLVLRWFVDFLSDPNPSVGDGVAIAILFFALNLIQSLMLHKHFHICMRAGLRCREALMALTLHKAMTISARASANPDFHPGRVINMMSGDVERINEFCGYVHYAWSSPLQVIVSLGMMYSMVGWVSFACIALMLVTSPLQGVVFRRMSKLRQDFLAATDRRVKAVNELFGAIRIVKYMGWEPRFEESVTKLREIEIGWLKRIQVWRVGSSFIMGASPVLVMAGVFILYHASGHQLTPRVVFPVISLLNILRFPFMMIPSLLTMAINCQVSVNRLSHYLAAEDGQTQVARIDVATRVAEGIDAVFEHATIAAYQSITLGSGGTSSPAPQGTGGAGGGDASQPAAGGGAGRGGTVSNTPVPAVSSAALLPAAGNAAAASTTTFRAETRTSSVQPPLSINTRPSDTVPNRATTTNEKAPLLLGSPSPAAEGHSDAVIKGPSRLTRLAQAVVARFSYKAPQLAGEVKAGDKPFQIVEKVLLHDINVQIPQKRFTVVIGPTGCGKSIFLQALLGHLTTVNGTVACHASVAYAPQQPWIMNATVRDNIVFFDHMQADRYERALSCCQLLQDLRDLPAGDETEIGEKGVNLSGGQKARVNLARAVYASRQVYLLDDPLSAVDAHVSEKLVTECFLSELKNTTRVLATHQLHVLRHADHIVALNEGRVAFQGDFGQYKLWAEEQRAIAKRLAEEKAAAASGASGMGGAAATSLDFTMVSPLGPVAAQTGGGNGSTFAASAIAEEKRAEGTSSAPPQGSSAAASAEVPSDEEDDGIEGDKLSAKKPTTLVVGTASGKSLEPTPTAAPPAPAGTKLMTTEERAVGSVPFSTYLFYWRQCGGWLRIVGVLILFAVTEVINISSSVWLSIWSQQLYGLSQNQYLTFYIVIVCLSIFNYASRAYAIYDSLRIGSLNLHRLLLASVSRATMQFFDTTPLGRVLNRFAKDIDQCDNDLPMDFLGMLQVVFGMTSSWCVMIVSQPFVLVTAVPVIGVYIKIMNYFNAANREIKRVDSINKSPVFALLSEAIEGARQIASYGREQPFLAEGMRRLNAVFSSSYLQQVANRWLGVRLEFMGNILVSTVAIAGVIVKLKHFGSLDVGMLSLGLTLSLSVTQLMNWTVRTVAAVEADMNAIERILHYTTRIDLEDFSGYVGEESSSAVAITALGIAAAAVGSNSNNASGENAAGDEQQRQQRVATAAPTKRPRPRNLPSHDDSSRWSIEFRDVSLRYREGLPLVLKKVSFTIASRTKVGIIGRTGSGKSTTLLAFLRLVDVAEGQLLIAGIDAREFSLSHLRSLFAMIPQDPVLFNGTVRSNLDPFNEHSDETILRAVELVGMTQRIEGEGYLEASVNEGGKNFSVGQRQLLCLARAILKTNCHFILMDEATANIDHETDKRIQGAMRTAFQHQTVIVIAHRLHTIVDADQLIVMDGGHAKEVGKPVDLMNVPDGIFASMIDAHGPKMAGKLRLAAAKAEEQRAAAAN